MDTLEEVRQVMAANLDVPAASIQIGLKASDLPQWDSLRHLVLVMEIEQKFRIKFALEEIADLDSVEKLFTAVQKRVAP